MEIDPATGDNIGHRVMGIVKIFIEEMTDTLFKLRRLAAFTTDNRLGFFTGEPRAARLTTADVQLSTNSRSFVQQARAVADCRDFTLTAITSDKHGGARTEGQPVPPYPATGVCHFRSSALLHAFRMEIPQGTNWKHAIGIDPVARPEGQR